MMPTLPGNLRMGAPVFALVHDAGSWRPTLIGHVKRATASGYELQGQGSRLLGYTECPLFTSMEEAAKWAVENPPKIPSAPGEFGNAVKPL